jgi:hypothetical protein
VVRLTEALDGPGSPITDALAAEPPRPGRPAMGGDRPPSLADRVRALKEAAAAR